MKKILTVLGFAIYCHTAFAFDGLVTHVSDGDTLTVMNEKGTGEVIRITYMDAPELKHFAWGYQPYASEARTSLLNLCGGKLATIIRKTTDKYGRTAGRVSCQGFDVATWQITNGFAWPYHYNTPVKYKALAATAKSKHLGLWGLENPVDPWAWRKLSQH